MNKQAYIGAAVQNVIEYGLNTRDGGKGGSDGVLEDLLTDARHYADAHGLDFGAIDNAAHQHYLNETGIPGRPVPRR